MDEEFVYEEPPEIQIIITPRVQAALDELRATIATQYPDAVFSVYTWYESAGIYLEATIDTDDIDVVRDVFMDRLLDIQIEEGIPVYVDVRQPPERAQAQTRAIQEEQWQARKQFDSLPDRIVQDPAIARGRPVIKGTRVRVETILAHLAHTLDVEALLSLYPELTLDDVRACLDFARGAVAEPPDRDEPVSPLIGRESA